MNPDDVDPCPVCGGTSRCAPGCPGIYGNERDLNEPIDNEPEEENT